MADQAQRCPLTTAGNPTLSPPHPTLAALSLNRSRMLASMQAKMPVPTPMRATTTRERMRAKNQSLPSTPDKTQVSTPMRASNPTPR